MTGLVPRRADPARCPATVYLAGLAPSGRRSQAGALRVVAGLLAPGVDPVLVPWEAVRFQHVQALRSALVERGYAAATVNRVLAALRGVVRAAWGLGLCSTDDRLRVEDLRGVPGRRLPAGRMLSLEEVGRLLGAGGPRDAAAVALLYGAGLRVAEACAVPVEAVEGCVLRLVGKGGAEREVPLAPWVAEALRAWGAVRGRRPGSLLCREDGRPLHPNSLASALAKCAAAAGIGRISPHDLRRSFVSHLLGVGADLALVQRLAGHADPRTTARYDRRPLQEARAAVEAISPPVEAVPPTA